LIIEIKSIVFCFFMSSDEKKKMCLMIFYLAGLIVLAGCGEQNYKSQADETVYNIIDRKWQDNFGSKANYKISDVESSPNDIKIEKVIPDSGILTLPLAVEIATAHNRQYQLERELLYTKALDLRLARHAFEPQFFGGAGGGYSKDGDDETVGIQGNIGFNQLLATGVRISTNVTVAWGEMLTGNIRGGLVSLLNATNITLPLLRGSDSKIVMENLTQAERDTVYQIRLFNRYRQTFVVSVISQYYLVLQKYDFLKNAENNHKTLAEIYSKTETLVNAGRLPRYELDRTRQEILDAKDSFIQAQKDYQQALDEFKISLSLPATTKFKLDENELAALRISGPNRPDFSQIAEAGQGQPKQELTTEKAALLEKELELLELLQPDQDDNGQSSFPNHDTKLSLNHEKGEFSEEDVIETALALRLDLANKNDAIDDAKRKVLVAKDNLRAGLNLIAGTETSYSNYYIRHIGGFSDSSASTGIGMELDLPLDRMAESNEYRKALIALNQRQREFEEAADTVVLEMRQDYRDLTNAAERYRVQLDSLELAQKRLNNTLLLMQYGRVNSRRVLDAQKDLFDAQNAATDTMTNHTIAMLSFYRDTGVLQVKPDGMWKLN
jgi:outer membrane protein TolC